MRIIDISFKNLWRRPERTLAMFLGIAALSGTLFTVTVVYLSINNALRAGGERLGADALAVPVKSEARARDVLIAGGPAEFYMKESVKEKIRDVDGVEASSSQLFILSAPLDCCSISETVLIGFDPENDFTVTPWLKKSIGRPLKSNEIIVGTNISAEPGGRLRFYGRELLIAGKLEPTGMDFIDGAVFIPIETGRQMIAESAEKALTTIDVGSDEISAVLLRIRPGVNPEELALRIEYKVPDVRVILSGDITRQARRNFLVPAKAVVLSGALQWSISLLMIAIIYSLTLEERKREIGLMRGIGAGKKDIAWLFICEVLIICVSGGIAGMACGLALVTGFRRLIEVFFNVPFLILPTSELLLIAFAGLALTVISGFAATAFSIVRASGRMPHDVMSGG